MEEMQTNINKQGMHQTMCDVGAWERGAVGPVLLPFFLFFFSRTRGFCGDGCGDCGESFGYSGMPPMESKEEEETNGKPSMEKRKGTQKT